MCWYSGRKGIFIGITIISILIAIGIPIVVYNVVIKDPTFTIDYASITGFNLTSDNHLTSLFNIILPSHNPNHKLDLKYRHIRVVIYKGKQKLAEDSVQAFTQRIGNVTIVRAEPIALNVGLEKGPGFGLGLESDKGFVDFDVRLKTTLNGIRPLEINCVHVVVNLTAPPIVQANSSSSDDNVNNYGQSFGSVRCFAYVFSSRTQI